jgi:hypothetical protein
MSSDSSVIRSHTGTGCFISMYETDERWPVCGPNSNVHELSVAAHWTVIDRVRLTGANAVARVFRRDWTLWFHIPLTMCNFPSRLVHTPQ